MRRARIIEMDCARTRRDRAAIRVRVPRGSETDRAWSVVPGNGVSEGFSSAFSTCSRKFSIGDGSVTRVAFERCALDSIGFRERLETTLDAKTRRSKREASFDSRRVVL
jgi:hypothetical protein